MGWDGMDRKALPKKSASSLLGLVVTGSWENGRASDPVHTLMCKSTVRYYTSYTSYAYPYPYRAQDLQLQLQLPNVISNKAFGSLISFTAIPLFSARRDYA